MRRMLTGFIVLKIVFENLEVAGDLFPVSFLARPSQDEVMNELISATLLIVEIAASFFLSPERRYYP